MSTPETWMYVDVCLRLIEFQEDDSFDYELKRCRKVEKAAPGSWQKFTLHRGAGPQRERPRDMGKGKTVTPFRTPLLMWLRTGQNLDWSDGLVVENTCYSCRGAKLNSQH